MDPIESIDISTSEGQEKAIAFFLHQTGKDQEDIEARIKLYREKGILAEKAEEFQGEIRKAFDKFVEQEKERAIEAKTKTEEALKEYRKNLTEKIGARFELNDSAKKKLVDFAAKPTNENKFLLDEKLREIRMNPEEAAELALFVLDKEEYIKQVTNKKVTDEKIKTAIRL
ncbi:hypothetical protein EBU94_08825, partial [bacterium]|nr:hypothetical protein [bacterium]